MSVAATRTCPALSGPASRPVAGLAGVSLLLAVAVAARTVIAERSLLDGAAEGAVFGFGLVAIAAAAGRRPRRPAAGPLLAGGAAGAALVAIAVASHWPAAPMQLGHAAGFGPWLGATALVATGEELVLRGALWDWTRRTFAGRDGSVAGDVAALLFTTVVFAAIHVPLYGTAVIPLDLAAGLVFGGLRLAFGGPAAPAAAHVLADVATWWL